MKLVTVTSILLCVLNVHSSPSSETKFALDKSDHHRHAADAQELSKHFWHSVCGLRSIPDELMSAAITSDCIRTYGMSQSDRKNNAVNRLLLQLRDLEEQKQTTTTKKRSQRQLLRKLLRRSAAEDEGEMTDKYLKEPPRAQILSPSVTRVTIGGTLNLECVVREEPPTTVWWWLNGTKLDLGHHRGGIYIETLRQKTSSTSKLIVADFNIADAGVYECRASRPGYVYDNPAKSSVIVTVIDPTKAPLYSTDQYWEGGSSNHSNGQKLTYALFLFCMLQLIF